MFSYKILKFQTFCFKVSYVINNLQKGCEKWDGFLSHCKNIMTSGGYYVATHILTVWKHLAGLAPDWPHSWSFPDGKVPVFFIES